MMAAFEDPWGAYVPLMLAFVSISVGDAEMILSPAYDIGHGEEDLRAANLARLNAR